MMNWKDIGFVVMGIIGIVYNVYSKNKGWEMLRAMSLSVNIILAGMMPYVGETYEMVVFASYAITWFLLIASFYWEFFSTHEIVKKVPNNE